MDIATRAMNLAAALVILATVIYVQMALAPAFSGIVRVTIGLLGATYVVTQLLRAVRDGKAKGRQLVG